MRFQRFLPLAVLLFGTIQAHAAPTIRAPDPPAVVYRADGREPDSVFRDGFQSWSAHLGGPANSDLLTHVQGRYSRSDSATTTNWVSTSQDLSVTEVFGVCAGVNRGCPQHVWIYDIWPTQDAYYVPWAFTDYLQRNPPGSSVRANAVVDALRLYGNQEEWAFRNGIAGEAIIQARRFDLRLAADGSYQYYEDSGVRIPNPHHRRRLRPQPQTVNPLDGEWAEPESVIVLGYETLSAANATMRERPISLGMSCLGVAASTSSTKDKRDTDGPDGCYDDLQHVVQVRSPTQLRYSPLAFDLHTDSTDCAWPRVFSSFYGVGLDTCTKAPRFLYDEYKRLYIRDHGVDWCMAVSPSVVDGGRDAWDYVKLEPCALNSVYQKWHIVGGKIYTHKGFYPVQDWMWSLIVSRKKDGYGNTLDSARMSSDFFKGPSPSQSRQVELQMGWNWKGATYYSTFNATGAWDTRYWNRSYYDYKTQRISYIDLSAVSGGISRGPALKYCLRSLLGVYTWNWTEWIPCRDDQKSPPSSQQWVMKSTVDAWNYPDQVEWVSQYDPSERLWVQMTGQDVGQYFSAKQGFWRNATHVFSVRKDAILLTPAK